MYGTNGKHPVNMETGTLTSVYNDCGCGQGPMRGEGKKGRHASKIRISFLSASLDVEFPLAKPQVKTAKTVTWVARANTVLESACGCPIGAMRGCPADCR